MQVVIKFSFLLMGVIAAVLSSVSIKAAEADNISSTLPIEFKQFKRIHEAELGKLSTCKKAKRHVYKLCSPVLKNEEVAPYIYYHDTLGAKGANKQSVKNQSVFILFHGLSDSPFYFKSVAEHLHSNGHTVVVALLPAHGLIDADEKMYHSDLKSHWIQYVRDIVAATSSLGDKQYIGGFSTGGALATQYAIEHSSDIQGLLLFSSALALGDGVERLSRVWGIKTIAKLIDGDYEENGPTPFKYKKVSGYAGLVLMDIIRSIRERVKDDKISLPLFVAHSAADTVTPVSGVQQLLEDINGSHTFFAIDESRQVCHAELMLDKMQITQLKFDASQVNAHEQCAVPKANPLHAQMLNMLDFYLGE